MQHAVSQVSIRPSDSKDKASRGRPVIDLAGKVIGRLSVVAKSKTQEKGKHTRWDCVCECGTPVTVSSSHLRAKAGTRSCGCLKAELQRASVTTHGNSKHPLYSTWKLMHHRCNNPKDARYGGRGITVDPRWASFEVFLQDMGERPEGFTLDRKDNNQGYSPENCRWATPKQQAENKTNRRVLVYLGEAKSLTEHCEFLGLSTSKVRARLDKLGWTVEKALSTA
jgi:hypothetical protein